MKGVTRKCIQESGTCGKIRTCVSRIWRICFTVRRDVIPITKSANGISRQTFWSDWLIFTIPALTICLASQTNARRIRGNKKPYPWNDKTGNFPLDRNRVFAYNRNEIYPQDVRNPQNPNFQISKNIQIRKEIMVMIMIIHLQLRKRKQIIKKMKNYN